MSNENQTPPAPGEQESEEPTLMINRSDDATLPPASPDEPTQPASPVSSEETVVSPSASVEPAAQETPPPPKAQAIQDQDTVVSPRLRQLAQTPSQPLRPPSGTPPKPLGIKLPASGSASRLYMLIGVVAVLVLLALILVGVILARNGPALLAGLSPTKTPVLAPTRAATPTSAFPPTNTPPPPTPTVPPTPVPPTPTPRPAPTAIAVDVLAKVTPPEGTPLKVRESPSTTAKILGQLNKDVQVSILDGPKEANGITWWKVDDGKGLVGWSAEGLGGVKYLVPIGWAR